MRSAMKKAARSIKPKNGNAKVYRLTKAEQQAWETNADASPARREIRRSAMHVYPDHTIELWSANGSTYLETV